MEANAFSVEDDEIEIQRSGTFAGKGAGEAVDSIPTSGGGGRGLEDDDGDGIEPAGAGCSDKQANGTGGGKENVKPAGKTRKR